MGAPRAEPSRGFASSASSAARTTRGAGRCGERPSILVFFHWTRDEKAGYDTGERGDDGWGLVDSGLRLGGLSDSALPGAACGLPAASRDSPNGRHRGSLALRERWAAGRPTSIFPLASPLWPRVHPQHSAPRPPTPRARWPAPSLGLPLPSAQTTRWGRLVLDWHWWWHLRHQGAVTLFPPVWRYGAVLRICLYDTHTRYG